MTNEKETQQGASYPYVPLATALAVAEAVKQAGGKTTPVPKSLLASTLKEDEKSQNFSFKIAAAKCFGLIQGRSAFTLTENAIRHFFPITEADKVEPLLLFLQCPSGFAEIIKRFDGQKLPEQQMLANIFHTQLRVPESWSARAATFFVRSAQHIGIIDDQNILRFDAAKHGALNKGKENSPTASAPAQSVLDGDTALESSEAKTSGGYYTYTLPLSNKRKITVIAPLDVTAQEIKRLKKWEEFTLLVDWDGEKEKEDAP